MPNDDTHKPPPEADDMAPKSAPLRWLRQFIDGFKIVTGLSLITVLSSVAIGYFQYLNAYQEKVSSQAKEDMTLAAGTFTEISRAFSEMQALQQTLYTDFARAVENRAARLVVRGAANALIQLGDTRAIGLIGGARKE